jgi:hypothetical protein
MTIGAGWAEGAWVDASWVVGAWAQPTATKTIGGTSQLEAFASSGTLTVQNQETIGGTSQLEVFNSTGGINLGFSIGGTSQLQAFTSSGFIQVGDAVVVDTDQPTGGSLAFKLEQERYRKEDEKQQRKAKKAKDRKISNEIDRKLALAERDLEAREARDQELARLSKLVEANKTEIIRDYGKLEAVVERALEEQSFASLEIMERRLEREMEEMQFLLMATRIILNG